MQITILRRFAELLRSPSHIVQKSVLETISFISRIDSTQALILGTQAGVIMGIKQLLLTSVDHEVKG